MPYLPLSRRDFLKRTGRGGTGLVGLSMLPDLVRADGRGHDPARFTGVA